MNANDAIRKTMSFSSQVLKSYVSDLSDAELMQRPAPGCNHLAWQLGHLISSECGLLNMICPGFAPQLPDGFEKNHSKDAKDATDPQQFCSKDEYLALMEKVRSATEKALTTQTAENFDQPAPEHIRQLCPTVGDVWCLIAIHGMMHAGQFVPVRRALGKAVVI
jgi:hypothetical protein